MDSKVIVSAAGTHQLSQNLGRLLNLPVYLVKSEKFPNQESKLKIDQVGATTILVGSLSDPVNTRIIEYLLAADAIKRQGCRHIIGVLSYLAYSKQDKVFLPGEPLSVKVIATILQTSPLSELLTIDLHNPSISGYFDFPVTNLTATQLLADTAKTQLKDNSMVISPDQGSIKNSSRFADLLGLPLGFASKQRDLNTGVVTISNLSHDVNGKNIFIYDDMIATGNTLIELAEILKSKGAASINVYCTHHLYLDGVQAKLDASPIDRLTVTNTISKPDDLVSAKLSLVDCAPIISSRLAEEMLR